MKLFFDLDGTIIENRTRYYRVHQHCLGQTPCVLSEEEYWGKKRSRTSEADILAHHYPQLDIKEYQRKRDAAIEAAEFLHADKVFPFAFDTLKTLIKKHTLILVTLRRNEKTAREEIRTLGLDPFFREIRIMSPDTDPVQTKMKLLYDADPQKDWIIGDTEADIRAGENLKLTTCAVLSGIRNELFLRSLEPTYILPSIAELVALLHETAPGRKGDEDE